MKSRLAKARLVAMLEREEEKKNEETYLENGLLFDELLYTKENEDDILMNDEEELVEKEKIIEIENKVDHELDEAYEEGKIMIITILILI